MPRDASSQISLRRLLRAGLFGLGLGCAIGGIILMGIGGLRWRAAPSCPDGAPACVLERDLSRDIGMRQLGMGGALTLLSLGMWLLRGEREQSPPGTGPVR